jgi:hypothetical protein
MSGTEETNLEVELDTELEPGAEGEQKQTTGEDEHQENEVEAKARKFGWRPKEEYRGNPDEWRSAEEFIDYGEKTNPILRQNMNRVEKENARLQKELEEVRKSAKEFAEFQGGIEQRAYERAVAELKARRKQAIVDADGDALERAENDLEQLAQHKPKPRVEQEQPKIDPVVAQWNQSHQWYGQDDVMTAAANVIATKMAKENPESVKDKDAFLSEMVKRVKKEFPHKFTPTQVRRGNAVEGASAGGNSGGSGNGKRTYANLPADAQKQCDTFIKQGYIKSREEYAKHYQWE